MKTLQALPLFFLLLAFQLQPSWAEPEPSSNSADGSQGNGPGSELEAQFRAAGEALLRGPVSIPLAGGGGTTLDLPANFGFVPKEQAQRLMSAMGNRPDPGMLGMIFPVGDGETADQWFVVVAYEDSGYIRDEDARNWNAEELLDSIRQGTEETNGERRSKGIGEIEVVGWVQRPLYDEQTNRLIWSISSREKGQSGAAEQGINYRTLVLGREGYLSMTMVTGLSAIEALKPVAGELLAAVQFQPGKRYADFNESTDRVAEYGLAALVAGVAAKKLGLFAMAAVFMAKFAKAIGLAAVVAVGALGKRWRNRGQSDA